MRSNKTKQAKADKAALNWLARLQSPQISSADEAEFFEWLEASPVNQVAYIRAEQTWQRGEVLARVHRVEDHATLLGLDLSSFVPKFQQSLFPQVSAFACMLLIFLGVWFFQFSSFVPKTEEYQTARGQQLEIALSDGSAITLNTNSSIRIEYERNKRIAYLQQGEVFFDIESNPNRPFEVHGDFGVVRVLGTKFTVRDLDEKTLVTVVEGSVGLSDESVWEESTAPDATLTANEQITFERAVDGFAPEKIDSNALTAWRNKKLIYRGEALEDVIADLNRYFETQIRLADDRLAQKQVVAVLRIDDFESTLATLENSLQLGSVNLSDKDEVLLIIE